MLYTKHCVTLTSEYFPLYFPRLLSTLSSRCNNCSLERDSALPGGSSASLSISEGGSYVGAPWDSFSPKGVRESRDELRTRFSLEGERNKFSARLAPLRINDSIEGTFNCNFWANDCVSSLCREDQEIVWTLHYIHIKELEHYNSNLKIKEELGEDWVINVREEKRFRPHWCYLWEILLVL